MLTVIFGWITGFLGIEVVSSLIHRYLMHGPLWWIHQTHHKPKGGWELNDWFAVLFGSVGVALLFGGFLEIIPIFWGYAGAGVSVYGLVYFVLHDILVHSRLGSFPKPVSRYLIALRTAHRMHHKHTTAQPGESYGLLFFHYRYFSDQRADSDLRRDPAR
ncbi:MAG: fatty acid hydroxylase [Sphingomonadales bacterium]|nr:fatty acid hydroxylase [Sphingomonadales bacterium]